MKKPTAEHERRGAKRYKYPKNITSIRTRVISSIYRPDDITFIDFSHTGLGLISNHNIPIGAALDLEMSVDDKLPVLLKAVISNRRKLDTGYRYGAFFEPNLQANAQQVEDTLVDVEDQLGSAQLEFFP